MKVRFAPLAPGSLGENLTLDEGEWLSITGPSGAGKTTLLSLLGGLEAPQSGRLEVGGQDLTGLSGDDLAAYRRATVGFVFQHFGLLETLTAAQNVALPMQLRGGSRGNRMFGFRVSRRAVRWILPLLLRGLDSDDHGSKPTGFRRFRHLGSDGIEINIDCTGQQRGLIEDSRQLKSTLPEAARNFLLGIRAIGDVDRALHLPVEHCRRNKALRKQNKRFLAGNRSQPFRDCCEGSEHRTGLLQTQRGAKPDELLQHVLSNQYSRGLGATASSRNRL
mgnify:CR=1 FL=1